MTWPTIGNGNDDNYALDVLSAILAGPRTARLTKSLVYDKQWAASVGTNQDSRENTGEFSVSITPRPGHTLTELENAADSIIADVRAHGVTADEVTRAKAGLQLSFVRGLQSNLGKAFQLDIGQTFDNDPGHLRVDYAKAQAVTAADVQRVAEKYLTKGRIVLSVVPTGKKDEAAKADQSQAAVDPFAPASNTGTGEPK
jgi:zinc protease